MPLAPLPRERACLTNNNRAATLAICRHLCGWLGRRWHTFASRLVNAVVRGVVGFCKGSGGVELSRLRALGSEAKVLMGRRLGWGLRMGACARLPFTCSNVCLFVPRHRTPRRGPACSLWAAPGPRVHPQRPPAAPNHLESRSSGITGQQLGAPWSYQNLCWKPRTYNRIQQSSSGKHPSMHPCIQYKSTDTGTDCCTPPLLGLRAGVGRAFLQSLLPLSPVLLPKERTLSYEKSAKERNPRSKAPGNTPLVPVPVLLPHLHCPQFGEGRDRAVRGVVPCTARTKPTVASHSHARSWWQRHSTQWPDKMIQRLPLHCPAPHLPLSSLSIPSFLHLSLLFSPPYPFTGSPSHSAFFSSLSVFLFHGNAMPVRLLKATPYA